jgi:pimeloyl-ACP methyl ester carboxylesterase
LFDVVLVAPPTARRREEQVVEAPTMVRLVLGEDVVQHGHEVDALPLIVTHGWRGASGTDAFHLVIPSLPGHGFSAKPSTRCLVLR